MQVIDNNGAVWHLDEGARERAKELQRNPVYGHLIGHVDLDQVIFVRLVGSKAKWLGKCTYVGGVPLSLISRYVVGSLRRMNIIDPEVKGVDENFFDLRFIITLNDDLIMGNENPENTTLLEDGVIVHELMHIHSDGDKLVRHDLEDFTALVELYGPRWGNGSFDHSNLELLES